MAKSDKFVLADHLQFSKGGFQNRNRIRTNSNSQGWIWLTVPVLTHGRGHQKINEVQIDNSTPWAKRHWQLIYFNYKRTPFFNKYADFFKKLYSKKWEKLVDLNKAIIDYIKEELAIKTTIVRGSDYKFQGGKTDLIVELCKEFKADAYFSGIGGRSYVDEEKLRENKIKLIFSDFKNLGYPQRFEPFVENLSVIDLLFNCGPKSTEVISSGNKV